MKKNLWPALVIAGLAVGFVVGGGNVGKVARGQTPQDDAAGAIPFRFQLHAWAHGSDNQGRHGCYILDTATGELWHSNMAGRPKKIGVDLAKEMLPAPRP
jgi:hypothetical protein